MRPRYGRCRSPTTGKQLQPYYGPRRPTSGLAITALVLGVHGGAIFAVLFGHLALNDIKATGEEGRGMAIAAWSRLHRDRVLDPDHHPGHRGSRC